MKLPLLLTQFLYQHKHLNLPGIGSFTLDPNAIIPDEHSKDLHITAGIAFDNIHIGSADPDLIEFIRTHTGKIKPLAIADLDSFLTLGTELLNIGKPFYLEGIGNLTKTSEGKLIFSPGDYTTTRLEETSTEKAAKPRKRVANVEEAHYETAPPAGRSRSVVVTLAVIAGLVLVGWGGYMMYRKSMEKPAEMSTTASDTAVVKQDTTKTQISTIDSSARTAPSNPGGNEPGNYKFIILSTHNKERALKRYNQLLSFQLKIFMETKDSSFFKVYFSFPAQNKDTVHIKDSLRREYAHDVIIER